MSKKCKKVIINAVFIVVLFICTIYVIFKDHELNHIMEYIHRAKDGYLILGLFAVVIFICSEAVIIKRLLRTLKNKVPLLRCCKYSFIGFFFSMVTPSSTGGQPAQVLYMKQDGIRYTTSTIVLMMVTIEYKIVLILMGLAVLVFPTDFLFHCSKTIHVLYYIGIISNILFVMMLMFILFKEGVVKKMLQFCIGLMNRMHMQKKSRKLEERALKAITHFHGGADFIRCHPVVLLETFFVTIFQRIMMFSVTYLVYRSFGLSEYSFLEIFALQVVLALAVDMLPIPGSIGASESSYIVLFRYCFGAQLILPGMILCRGITFYAPVLLSAGITFAAHILATRKGLVEHENR